jgi:hypothetical protein
VKDHLGNEFNDASADNISKATQIKIVAVTGGYTICVSSTDPKTQMVKDVRGNFVVYTNMFHAKKAVTDINPKVKITLVSNTNV